MTRSGTYAFAGGARSGHLVSERGVGAPQTLETSA